MADEFRTPFKKYYEEGVAVPPLEGKSIEQLKGMVSALQKQTDILNRELKSKQIVIDIKTEEAKTLNDVVKLLLNAAAVASMAIKERG